MVKLTKTSPSSWNGTGFGTSAADWAVVGHEQIAVRKLGINWFAVDTKSNQKIARADTKADLVSVLSAKLA